MDPCDVSTNRQSTEATQELADALVQLSFVLQSAIGRVGDRSELSNTQVRLLAVLEDRQIGMAELAGILELGKSSVTGLVDRAERRGLVCREQSEDDRRAIRVVLTDRSRRIVASLRADMHETIATLTESIEGGRRKELLRDVKMILERYDGIRGASQTR